MIWFRSEKYSVDARRDEAGSWYWRDTTPRTICESHVEKKYRRYLYIFLVCLESAREGMITVQYSDCCDVVPAQVQNLATASIQYFITLIQ